MLRGYREAEVIGILKEAAKLGAQAAAKVLKPKAPIGTAERLSQYYRRLGLQHGTFRRTIRAAAIRGRGSAIQGLQGRTIGWVIGPMGKNAFTRHWIEYGTRHARSNPWVERSATEALSVARGASDAVLSAYARRT